MDRVELRKQMEAFRGKEQPHHALPDHDRAEIEKQMRHQQAQLAREAAERKRQWRS